MRIDAANGVIEVGHILFGPRLARTRAATEAIYLLARHVFDDLGYGASSGNATTATSPEACCAALGLTLEGVFRQHMIVKGENRDTAWFSMLDREWPARKQALKGWLDPGNFDAAGRQRTPLRRPV